MNSPSKMPTTVKFIYFDLGNVLFNFDHSLICEQVSEVSGVPTGDICGFIEQGDWSHQLETGSVTLAQIHGEFCQSFKATLPLDQFETAMSDIFEMNAPVLPLVTMLLAANFPVGILSNTSQPHWDFLASRYRLLRKFPVVALSYEIGVMKPDLDIYERSTELARVAPQNILFTDDRSDNVEGALAAGWQAVQFESASQVSEEFRRRGVLFN